MEARMTRLGIPWVGDYGAQSTHYYEGIFFVFTAPDVFGAGDGYHDLYIRDEMAVDNSIWRISSWHKNMRAMQVGGKSDDTGWGVYEESRRAGAIIATGHEHSYSRTHLLSSMENQTIASTDNTLVLSADDTGTPGDEGRSFAFVSGIAGKSIRDQELSGAWWASIYTSTQNANHGALFGTFNYQGDPCLAYFYFKNIDDVVVDEFYVESTCGPCGDAAPASVVASVYRRGTWYLDVNGNDQWDGGDTSFAFGLSADIPLMGDWDGDGIDQVAIYRTGRWYLDLTGNDQWDGGDRSGRRRSVGGRRHLVPVRPVQRRARGRRLGR
jgi:hypothetical protein